MHLSRPNIGRGTAALACALAASALIACGGGGGADPLTPEQATAIVTAGLVAQEDLPEAAWDIEEVDNVAAAESGGEEDFDDFINTTPACEALAQAVGDSDGPDPLSDLERSFTSGGDALVIQSVESNVFVPHQDVDIDERFETLEEVFTADNLRACFEDGLRASLETEEGVTITAIEITEPEHQAPGGAAVAVDLAAVALIIPIDLHLEMHMWPEGPAVGSLMFMEINSTLLQQNAGGIVDNAHSRLAAAVEAN